MKNAVVLGTLVANVSSALSRRRVANHKLNRRNKLFKHATLLTRVQPVSETNDMGCCSSQNFDSPLLAPILKLSIVDDTQSYNTDISRTIIPFLY